jgi:hypothetical protein
MDSLLTETLRTHEQCTEIKAMLALITTIDDIPVHMDSIVLPRVINVYVYTNHPSTQFSMLLLCLRSADLAGIFDVLRGLKIHKCNNISQEKIDFLVKNVGGGTVSFVFDECPVCRDYTTYTLGCRHRLCPQCFVRCTKCPLCRKNFQIQEDPDADYIDDDSDETISVSSLASVEILN